MRHWVVLNASRLNRYDAAGLGAKARDGENLAVLGWALPGAPEGRHAA